MIMWNLLICVCEFKVLVGIEHDGFASFHLTLSCTDVLVKLSDKKVWILRCFNSAPIY